MAQENQHLKVAVSEEGAVILNVRLGQITTLNATGSCIWQGLERGETVEEIAAKLARETGEQLEALERDIRQFIDSLRGQHLLPNCGAGK